MVKDSGSVTGGRGMTVAPSPLNEVKLDLGIILAVGLLLLLVQGRAVDGLPLQFLLLSSYGLLGMIWIVVRVRRVVAKLEREREQLPDGPQ
jgi:hypothetical protein